jgi:CheY-specific phosphatase CheX
MMDKETLMMAMKNSISDVLEKMFFLPLDFPDQAGAEDVWGSDRPELLISKLDFSGPFSGRFLLYIPTDLARDLTASFLGTDDGQVAEEQVIGTVKEIVNMLAGSTFSAFDQDAIFDLEIPKLGQIGDSTNDEQAVSAEGIFVPIRTENNTLALQMIVAK